MSHGPPPLRFRGTSGGEEGVDLRTALFRNQPEGGGLYLPEALPRFDGRELKELRGRTRGAGGSADPLGGAPSADPVGVAAAVARRLFAPPLEEESLEAIVRSALDFPIPLVPLEERIWALELFHGPTLAFKDVGARFMARLMAHFHVPAAERPLTVLVATSGDTGSAVAQAFLGVPGTRTVVLFPDGRVSPIQERQFSTLGGNVRTLAVRGSFDDCQRLAKAAFADAELRERLLLTSANSINVGRLLPQILYYFHAWAQLRHPGRELVVSVPSGNFGNLTAGLMARTMGLPVDRFVAATNANDVVPEYLRTGVYRPRPSTRTLSTAMDVGEPSNFDRIRALYGDDAEALARDVEGVRVSDAETRETIRGVHERMGYVLDPHGAVAYAGLRRALEGRPGATGIFLATAHPAKFAETVEPAIGRPVETPARLAACLERERRVESLEPSLEALREVLLAG